MTIGVMQSLGGFAPAVVDCLRARLETQRAAWASANATAPSRVALPPAIPARAIILVGDEQQLPAQAQTWLTVAVAQQGLRPTASGTRAHGAYTVTLTAYTRRQVYRVPDPSSAATDADTTVQTSATSAAVAVATLAAQALVTYQADIAGVYHVEQGASAPARAKTSEVYAHAVTLTMHATTTTGGTTP